MKICDETIGTSVWAIYVFLFQGTGPIGIFGLRYPSIDFSASSNQVQSGEMPSSSVLVRSLQKLTPLSWATKAGFLRRGWAPSARSQGFTLYWKTGGCTGVVLTWSSESRRKRGGAIAITPGCHNPFSWKLMGLFAVRGLVTENRQCADTELTTFRAIL